MKVAIGPYPKEKSKAKRKISVRIDNFDLWSLDHTLAHIIHPALVKLRKAKAGAPGNLFDLSHHETMKWNSKEFKAAEKKSNRDGFKKWGQYLDEMIWAFDQIRRGNPDEPEIRPDIDGSKDKFDTYQKRVADGVRLFGEWYQALWT